MRIHQQGAPVRVFSLSFLRVCSVLAPIISLFKGKRTKKHLEKERKENEKKTLLMTVLLSKNAQQSFEQCFDSILPRPLFSIRNIALRS